MRTSKAPSTDQIKRGQAVSSLLEMSGLEQIFEGLRSQYMRELVSSKPHETAIREQCYQALRVVDHVKQQLLVSIANGQFEERKLRKENGRPTN